MLTGSTKFEPLLDTKNILVTGGAGFMYVDCGAIMQEVAERATLQAPSIVSRANGRVEHAGSFGIWS